MSRSTATTRKGCCGRRATFTDCHLGMQACFRCVIKLLVYAITVFLVCCCQRHVGQGRRRIRHCVLTISAVQTSGGHVLRRLTIGRKRRIRLGRLILSHFRFLSRLNQTFCRQGGAGTRRRIVCGRIEGFFAGLTSGPTAGGRLRRVMGAMGSGVVIGLQGRFPGFGPTSVSLLYCVCTKFSTRVVDIVVNSSMSGICGHGSELGTQVTTSSSTRGSFFVRGV